MKDKIKKIVRPLYDLYFKLKINKYQFLEITKKKYTAKEILNKRFFVCYKLIKKYKFEKVLEIGSFRGDLTYFLAKNIKNIQLNVIEPYDKYVDQKMDIEKNTMQKYKNDICTFLSSEINEKKIIFHFDKSQNIFEKFNENYFDFIFIDGDHSYQGCFNDLNNYYSKCRSGGIIAIHDYDRKSMIEVKEAVDKFCLEKKLKLNIDKNYVAYFFKS